MNLEYAVQLHWLPALHQLPAAEDDDVVGYQCHSRFGHCRHGRNARLEAKFFGLVAFDRLEGIGEDGPKLEAKGSFKCRCADLEPFCVGHVSLLASHGVGGQTKEEGEDCQWQKRVSRVQLWRPWRKVWCLVLGVVAAAVASEWVAMTRAQSVESF